MNAPEAAGRNDAGAEGGAAVAEIQGLYGAFTFPEKLLQKIWATGDFDRAKLVTTTGETVRIRHPGKWNLLGGPDFKGARLEIGGAAQTGDVELHLRAEDWAAHRHADDPAYRGVILHVVLFPPRPGHVTRGANGAVVPVAALLPLLHRDLESYAEDDAVEALADQALDEALQAWAGREPGELRGLLREHARGRWERKCRDARRRIERLGWTAACHYAALEILGYRFNRVAMLRVAGAWPLERWATGEASPETIWESERESWSVQGVRPANHPRARLRHYAAWAKARPAWPELLAKLDWPEGIDATADTGDVRRAARLSGLREMAVNTIADGAVGGTRWDTLVSDGFLPLLAAKTGAELFGLWWHWFPGDWPENQAQVLRRLGVFAPPGHPACQGALQGLLGWRVGRERMKE